ncbi:unnamed protein product, partial [Urochloa humidicola]
ELPCSLPPGRDDRHTCRRPPHAGGRRDPGAPLPLADGHPAPDAQIPDRAAVVTGAHAQDDSPPIAGGNPVPGAHPSHAGGHPVPGAHPSHAGGHPGSGVHFPHLPVGCCLPLVVQGFYSRSRVGDHFPSASGVSYPLPGGPPPFYPASAGRSKEARWLDGSDDDECVDYGFTPSPSPRPSTYRDAVCRGSPVLSPQAAAAPATAVATVPAASGGTADPVAPPARRRRRRPSRRARNRRAPPLRVAYPPRPPRVEERGPTRERLPPRAPAATPDSCRLPRVDADGFEEVLSRSNRRRLRRAEAASNRPSAPSSMRIPLEMRDRCL